MDQIGFDKIYSDMKEVMSMVSRSPDYKNHLLQLHSERGAFRSGDGTQDQRYERERIFIEKQRMEELEETKEIVSDASLAEKQFKYFSQQFKKKKGALQNDSLDLVPVEFVIDRSSSLLGNNGSARARADGSAKYGRALASNNTEPTL